MKKEFLDFSESFNKLMNRRNVVVINRKFPSKNIGRHVAIKYDPSKITIERSFTMFAQYLRCFEHRE